MNQRDILSHKTSERNRCENKHDITPATTKRWMHARDHREDNERAKRSGETTKKEARNESLKSGGKDENTVEVDGCTLVFLSFQRCGGVGGDKAAHGWPRRK